MGGRTRSASASRLEKIRRKQSQSRVGECLYQRWVGSLKPPGSRANASRLQRQSGVGSERPGNAIQDQARRSSGGVEGEPPDMDNYALCDLLLKAESESEVNEALRKAGYLGDDANLWQPFGGFEMNLNQINNQQSDATAALVEMLINSIDAVLMAECYRAVIDPK